MENKIDIKFVRDHYVNESDSLKEILDVSIGDKVEWDDRKWTITDISSTEITIFEVNSPIHDTLNISDIKLINLHVTGKGYTIWKTLKDYGKEDKVKATEKDIGKNVETVGGVAKLEALTTDGKYVVTFNGESRHVMVYNAWFTIKSDCDFNKILTPGSSTEYYFAK